MKILVINAGSSSLKYQLIEMENEEVISKGLCERIGIDGIFTHQTHTGTKISENVDFPTHTEAFERVINALSVGENAVIKDISEIAAVGHRVVQGAEIFSKTTKVIPEVIQKIDDLKELAPVHNHPHALALWAAEKVFPATTPQAVVFDTAFHSTIPEKAFIYGFPYDAYDKYAVRKYGFHGTSHRFVSMALADHLEKDITELKIISCHLGNGSSVTAIDGGKSVDTSMGFTPLDGVLMGTRCGAVDPSAVLFLQEKLGLSPKAMSDYLNKKSGFLGIGGVSDNRDISTAAEAGDKKAILVKDMLRYSIKKYIGSFAAIMGGVDAVIFTGGIGENDKTVRADACEGLEFLGIKIDPDKNDTRGEFKQISQDNSKVFVFVVPTNEELLIARDTKELFGLN